MRIALKISIYTLAALSLISCGGTFQVGILEPTDLPTTGTALSTSISALTPETTQNTPTLPATIQGQPTAPTLTQAATSTLPALPQSTTTTPTPCAPPTKWTTYTVKPGDTLFDLSQQTNTGVQQIRQANCLATDIIRTGQQIYLPFVPTPTFTPTLTSTPTPPLPTLDPNALFSPNGKRYATNAGVVVDVDQRLVASDILSPESLSTWRWTNDSRYIIFGRKNQFNSTYTYVFDTSQWKLVYSTNGCTIQSSNTALTDTCGDYPFNLSVNAPRFIMENGVLVDLTTLQSIDLLASQRPAQLTLSVGSWSLNGSYLAWVTADTSFTHFVLFLANGDGTQSQLLTELDQRPNGFQWLSDTTARITTLANTYVLDASAGTVETLATATVTSSPTVSPTP